MTLRHHVLLTSVLFAVCACQTAEPVESPFAPAPTGEMASAAQRHQDTIEVTSSQRFTRVWTQQASGSTRVAFGFAYNVVAGHELLAEQCVRNNWEAACEGVPAICETVRQQPGAGVAACEAQLVQHLNEHLFPCIQGAPIATITRIDWQTFLMQ